MARSSHVPVIHRLSRREREIMNVLFALSNRGSAEDVRHRLTNAPSYSAVRAMLVRLEQKGYVRHRLNGVRYIYSATRSHASARRDALREYLRAFFGGSLAQMMTTLVRDEEWTGDELDALEAEIGRVRKEGKRL